MDANDETQVDEMLSAYVECALWSSTAYVSFDDETGTFVEDENNDQSFLDHNFDSEDVASETLDEMRSQVEEFASDNADDLANMTAEQAGHDFWLTRNGHGAGFWDRGLGAIGERLTQASKPYGSYDLYMGDDGKIYGQ